MTSEQTQRRRIEIYDTTLRDGSQAEGISFSVADKIRIARRLDEFGIDYIEGGWPGSNPKDVEFFEEMKRIRLKHAKLAAFGSTRRANIRCEEDSQIASLLDAETPVVTIVGKTWVEHVQYALRTTLEENLAMIQDSVAYLKQKGKLVTYDAEHFFDGWVSNPEYAKSCLKAAVEGGAERLVLCDTNGGTMPDTLADIVKQVRETFPTANIGIHTHNDAECGVANALAAIREGAIQVQGTINGYGERCGNCNLIPVIASLRLKMGYDCLLEDSLSHLTLLSQFVDEVANLSHDNRRAYVGRSAFAHKGGLHADAILKGASYEHIDPELVGNSRRLLVSELAGSSSIAGKAAEYGLDLDRKSPHTRALLQAVTEREHAGFTYEGAEGSFELLMLRCLDRLPEHFSLKGFRCIVERRVDDPLPITEATVKMVVNGEERLTVAEGDGPIHALDCALRNALSEFYPELVSIRLTDFKVRVVNTKEGTAAKVRVIVESSDGVHTWSTIGVSTNVIEASWQALLDGVVYGLMHLYDKEQLPEKK